jgi:hypothetical protein
MTEITAPDVRHGWLGQDAARRALDRLGERFPSFFIAAQTRATSGRRVVLWDYTRKVLGGHLPTLRQEIGDCVSMGAANAVNYLACMEIVRLSDRERFRPAFPPFLYGVSRVQIGGGHLEGDGSLGIWAADAVRRFGVLAGDANDVPPYSGRLARRWGEPPGPPQALMDRAKPHLLKSTALVRTYEQVRDALINGYPVTIASTQGFRMRPAVDRGKHWGVPAGTWAHQMCLVGCDDDASRPGCYCLNSWGADAHGPPGDDAPPGGFWIDAHVVDRMVRQGDSFAFSQFEGFPEQELDFSLVG